ncbi:FAD-dependent oxidoreductase [Rhodococcus pyridinivorans]|uniref:phytoene desaturase family protein n=1 Tax=Rhodococcus pyridinivorans TaxID=103816 RepID=UPI002227B63F|nr:FAD-dependent oxidoreductase [Rhodococcus pyridinivorans]MCW3472643.1 FAD-dependent oxidoreductase [Rhodococcus pyridinivorans]
MTDNVHSFDALVVGAGAGGLFAAARLQHAGYRTLVVERLDKVGGRASTDDIEGFKVNNGAIVIETGGITEQTFAEVGAEFDIRSPQPPILYRLGGKDVDVSTGGWGFLLGKLTRQAAKIVKGIGSARNDSGLPGDEMTTAEWVAKYTNNESVHGIFRNMCGSVFAVGSEDLPARVFLTYFTRKSAFKKFGFAPQGTIGIWESLAAAFERDGGQLWLNSTVTKLTVSNGIVTGATVERDGNHVEIACRIAVSDIGPAATVNVVGEENLPTEYLDQVRRGDRPTSMITVNFASRDKLISAPGMLSFANTKRLCYVANFSELCPEMAPAGWNLYVGTAVPQPSTGDFDEDVETQILLDELRSEIAGFDTARVLSINVTRDGWPPQRAVSGFDLPNATPIGNLWNVGDGVKEYANGGTTACAETAQIVVEQIKELFPLGAAATSS